MTLLVCPDCEGSVSSNAAECPHCGCPTEGSYAANVCPYCGSNSIGRVRGLQGVFEVVICLILLLCLILPGIIYYIFQEAQPYCSGCGRRV